MITRLFIFLALTASAFGQTYNQAVTLTNLLTKSPVIGGLYSVRGYRVDGDWGNARQAMHVPGSTAATNIGNTFTFGTGRLIFTDRTNTVQDVRWWRGKPDGSTDNSTAIQAAHDWLQGIGGGTVFIPGATGNWRVAETVNFTNTYPVNLQVGVGAVVDLTAMDADATAFVWRGSTNGQSTLPQAFPRAVNVISVADASAFAAGDLIAITSTNLWNPFRNYYESGEYNRISAINGTNLTLVSATRAAYASGDSVIRVVPVSGRVFGGGRFACGTTVRAVRFIYGQNVHVEGIEATGSERSHILFANCIDFSLKNSRIWNLGGEGDGFAYGVSVGYSQAGVISGNYIETARHGVVIGSADGGEFDIVNRDILIQGNQFGSYSTNAASVDAHGNTDGVSILGNILRRGASYGGDNMVIEGNIQVGNPQEQPAFTMSEAIGHNFRIANNQVEITDMAGSQTVHWLRHRIARASDPDVSTNGWLGTSGLVQGGTFEILGNRIKVNTPYGATNAFIGALIDAQADLPASIRLGAFRYNGNTVDGVNATNLPATPYGLYLEHNPQISWDSIEVSGNSFSQFPSVVSAASPSVRVTGNTWRDVVSAEPALRIRGNTNIIPANVVISENAFYSTPRQAVSILDVTGKAILHGNRFFDYGTAGAYTAVSVGNAAVGSTNLTDILSIGNWFESDSGEAGYSGTASDTKVAFLFDKLGPGISESSATFNSLVGLVNTNGFLVAGAPTSFQGYETGSFPTNSLGDIALNSTTSRAMTLTTRGWEPIMTDTTNSPSFTHIRGQLLSLSEPYPGLSLAVPGTYPLRSSWTTNAFSVAQMVNADTGTSVGAGWEASVPGFVGGIYGYSTNTTSGSLLARLVVNPYTGNGVAFNLANSGQDVIFTTAAVEFARLSPTLLRLIGPSLRVDGSIAGGSVAITNDLTAGSLAATTNITAGGSVSGASGAFTNSLTAGALAVTTNATVGGAVTAASGAFTNTLTLNGGNLQPTNAILTSLGAVATNGILARTAAGTVATRHLVAGTGLSVADGDGVAANPTVTLANTAVTPGSYTSADITVDQQGRITAAVSGVGGGESPGFTLEDPQSNVIHWLTNLTLSVNVGDPLIIGLAGTPASASLDFQFSKAPLFVNDSPAAWSSPMNFNGTTPAAPTGYELVPLQVSGTNVSIYIPSRKMFTTGSYTTNATSSQFVAWTNSIPAGLLSAGDVLTMRQLTVWTNNSGGNYGFTPKWILGTNIIADATVSPFINNGVAAYIVPLTWQIDVIETNRWTFQVYVLRGYNTVIPTGKQIGDLGSSVAEAYTLAATNMVVDPTAGIPVSFLLQPGVSNAAFGVTVHSTSLLRN